MTRGRLIIISAPSGAGKTSVIHHLLERHPNMIHSVSWTTRPRRSQETDGKDYHFVGEGEFKKGVEKGRLAEWAEVHNACYGTPKEPLEQWLKEGKDVLLDLDVQGGMNLKKMYADRAVSIFLLPPSEEELERRLLERKTDSEQERRLRLTNATKEVAFKDHYDHQVINDQLHQACRAIERILKL
ncbi:MAG: guanylate kinase [Deltaproteobacteria bacterium]|nr:guanylate kinase [Deltaproteobacteria bacterium]